LREQQPSSKAVISQLCGGDAWYGNPCQQVADVHSGIAFSKIEQKRRPGDRTAL
jgi:hypothetical protein